MNIKFLLWLCEYAKKIGIFEVNKLIGFINDKSNLKVLKSLYEFEQIGKSEEWIKHIGILHQEALNG